MEKFSALSDSPSEKNLCLSNYDGGGDNGASQSRATTLHKMKKSCAPLSVSPFEENLFRALRTFFCQLDHLSLF